jgi:hypothetical protein
MSGGGKNRQWFIRKRECLAALVANTWLGQCCFKADSGKRWCKVTLHRDGSGVRFGKKSESQTEEKEEKGGEQNISKHENKQDKNVVEEE